MDKKELTLACFNIDRIGNDILQFHIHHDPIFHQWPRLEIDHFFDSLHLIFVR